MIATCPVDKGAVNAGPFPPEPTVSIAGDSTPEAISNDWRDPTSFSFVALSTPKNPTNETQLTMRQLRDFAIHTKTGTH